MVEVHEIPKNSGADNRKSPPLESQNHAIQVFQEQVLEGQYGLGSSAKQSGSSHYHNSGLWWHMQALETDPIESGQAQQAHDT